MGDKGDNKGDYIEVTYDDGTVKIPVTDDEERVAKAIATTSDNYENYKREDKDKLKRYFHYDGLNMIHLFGKVWLQFDNNVTDDKGFFRRGKGYEWYEGWFRFVICKYGIGLFFIDKGVLNYTWDRVVSRWEGRKNGR